MRVAGEGESTVILLHGLLGSGDIFGAVFDELADEHRLVVPDLLGFGGSLDDRRSEFGLDAQLDALDAMAEELALDGHWVIGGHSMGAVLGLHWAARHAARVAAVTAWSAPLYESRQEGYAHVEGLGLLERLFAMDTPLSRRACAWSCAHRRLSSLVSVAISPAHPVAIARGGVQHTWAAYRGAMDEVVLTSPWTQALATLDAARIPVALALGSADPVPVKGRARALAMDLPSVSARELGGAAHDLPLAHPAWSLDCLTSAMP
ncbi:MAG: alpha/beta fold hydrolase [Egibacteraceae bacterium]